MRLICHCWRCKILHDNHVFVCLFPASSLSLSLLLLSSSFELLKKRISMFLRRPEKKEAILSNIKRPWWLFLQQNYTSFLRSVSRVKVHHSIQHRPSFLSLGIPWFPVAAAEAVLPQFVPTSLSLPLSNLDPVSRPSPASSGVCRRLKPDPRRVLSYSV